MFIGEISKKTNIPVKTIRYYEEFGLQWPSLTTLVMWPILMFAYYRLAMSEEKNVEKIFEVIS